MLRKKERLKQSLNVGCIYIKESVKAKLLVIHTWSKEAFSIETTNFFISLLNIHEYVLVFRQELVVDLLKFFIRYG